MKDEKLNDMQKKAVEHVEGPLLVLAGAGSGKTRVVTQRIAHLIKIGVLPTDILAVTFTNKAANEMKERVREITNISVLTCTFHSLGAKILRESIHHLGYKNDFSIYDEDDSLKLIRNCLDLLNIKEEKGDLKSFKSQISSAKNDLLSETEIKGDSSFKKENIFNQIFPLYQTKLRDYNALDFDDLLYLPFKLFKDFPLVKEEYQNRWLFLLIDEYQDTNTAQYTLAKTLSAKNRNIFVVGDPDQSIYSWRGAKYQNILNFDKDFPDAKIINLEQNYRSTNTILSAANSVIKNNETRLEKNLWSNLGEGEKISIYISDTEKSEAFFVVNRIVKHHLNEKIALDDIVIFYRTNAQSRIFEDLLISQKIPYIIYGGISFYQRKEIKDIISFIRLIFSDGDFISFERSINIPKRGIGPTTISKLLLFSQNHQIPILKACVYYLEKPDQFSDFKLSKKQIDSLLDYLSLISHLRELALKKIPISEMISEIILKSTYLNFLKEDPDSFDERKENIDELIAKAAEYEDIHEKATLASFLEEISLLTNLEKDESQPSVKLMSLHNGKGLEFSLVFMVGMEEDVFPHINCKNSIEELEEERRLCYVGMTRAKKKLYMTAALYRYMWGAPKIMIPSRFLKEIPTTYLENLSENLGEYKEIKKAEKVEKSYEEIESIPSEKNQEFFSPGTEVIHKTFGIGTIIKAYNTSMGQTYDILFKSSNSTKTLVAKYAKLKTVYKLNS